MMVRCTDTEIPCQAGLRLTRGCRVLPSLQLAVTQELRRVPEAEGEHPTPLRRCDASTHQIWSMLSGDVVY